MTAGLADALIFTGVALLALIIGLFFRRGVAARRLDDEEDFEVVAGTAKRCPRCEREVSSLRPYISGRTEHHVCTMCAAEMDLKVAVLKVPKR